MGLQIDRSVRNTPGAYVLINNRTLEVYVGSSSKLRNRLIRHSRRLDLGEHHNSRFQLVYDECGGDIHVVTFECDDLESARKIEQDMLNNPPNRWKLCNVATDVSSPRKGAILTEKHKRAISMANKGKSLSPEHIEIIRNSRTGSSLSEETRKRMSLRLGGRPIEIDGVVYATAREAARAFGINSETPSKRARSPLWPTWNFVT